MRGKALPPHKTDKVSGITPAYAGKRRRTRAVGQNSQDHPRLCGEKPLFASVFQHVKGSPPPMRGKGSRCAISFAFPRITPAYAGKSQSSIPAAAFLKDHPRLCGEKWFIRSSNALPSGSPPPMRGKAHKAFLTRHRSGITPAYAGKSPNPSLILVVIGDHPRLCGEKFSRVSPSARTSGSPPPMRGKDEDHRTKAVMSGITPAYAGKSTRSRIHHQFSRDHPRLCGEKIKPVHPLLPPPGSPPPMRGKATANGFLYWNPRITPAYAGKRQIFMRSVCSSQDHPRLCGEKQPVPRQRIE